MGKSFSTVNGYRCALKSYYVSRNVSKVEIEFFDTFVNGFFQGYQRVIAQKRQNGEISAVEGKASLSFSGYRVSFMKALSFVGRFNKLLLVHTFACMCWDLGKCLRPTRVRKLARSFYLPELVAWTETSVNTLHRRG